MTPYRRLLSLLPLAVAACSGSIESPPEQTGTMDAGTVPDPCSPETPCPTEIGVSQTEFIFPVGDTDEYTFNVASPGQIISIVVSNEADLSPVVLDIALEFPDARSPVNRRSEGTGFQQRLVIQEEATVAGEHRLIVREVGNDAEDDRNPYRVQVDLLSQTDDNEPNDVAEDARLLIPGAAVSGTIGTQGDEDWFQVSVAENQLIEIAMTQGADSPVTLTWELYDPSRERPLAQSTEPLTSAAWPVEVRAVGSAAGNYLIVVRDDQGDGLQADLSKIYSLTVRLLPEPDQNDIDNGPNETSETATTLQRGVPMDGLIASISDFDWYAIEVTGASPESPRLLTVEAEMNGLSPVDLAFTVFGLDGETRVCDARDGFCCQAFRRWNDGSAGVARLRTAHPVTEDGVYFILVRDLNDDDADQATGYRLTADHVAEPDPLENFLLTGRNSAVEIEATMTGTSGAEIIYDTVQGYISHANDVDWYEYKIPGPVEPAPGHNGDYLIELRVRYTRPTPGETPLELQTFFYGESNSPRPFYRGFGNQCRQGNPDEPPSDPNEDLCQYPDDQNDFDLLTGEVTNECFVVFREVTGAGSHYFQLYDNSRLARRGSTPCGDDFDLGTPYILDLKLTPTCPSTSQCVNQFFGPSDDPDVEGDVDWCGGRP